MASKLSRGGPKVETATTDLCIISILGLEFHLACGAFIRLIASCSKRFVGDQWPDYYDVAPQPSSDPRAQDDACRRACSSLSFLAICLRTLPWPAAATT